MINVFLGCVGLILELKSIQMKKGVNYLFQLSVSNYVFHRTGIFCTYTLDTAYLKGSQFDVKDIDSERQ